MVVRSVANGPSSKYDLGDKVKTPSGLVGEIIGLAEFQLGWQYRIKVPGKPQTMYRDEHRLTLVMRGTKARREYWERQGKQGKKGKKRGGSRRSGAVRAQGAT